MGGESGTKGSLAGVKRIALDAAPFIYILQNVEEYKEPTDRLFGAIEKGEVEASTSAMTLTEILVQPARLGHIKAFEDTKHAVLNMPNLRLVSFGAEEAAEAARIRGHYGVRIPDAVHLACALTAGAQAFVTNDEKLKRFREIPVMLLGDI